MYPRDSYRNFMVHEKFAESKVSVEFVYSPMTSDNRDRRDNANSGENVDEFLPGLGRDGDINF